MSTTIYEQVLQNAELRAQAYAQQRQAFKQQPPQMALTHPDLKLCTGCRDWLPKRAFHANKREADGLHYHCSACRNAQMRSLRMRKAVR